MHFAVLFVVTVRHLQFQVKSGDRDATGEQLQPGGEGEGCLFHSDLAKQIYRTIVILPAATAKIWTRPFRRQAW